MISPGAEASIEGLFENAIRGNAVLPDDQCLIDWRDGHALPPADDHRRLVALTVSTYLFRIVALFDFGTDAATATHMARLTRAGKARLDGQELLDAFSELCNVICGEVNRGLSSTFRHAGMSTPFVLERSCMAHVETLAPSALWLGRVTVNDSVGFSASICLCAGKDADLDFHIDTSARQLNLTGELELF